MPRPTPLATALALTLPALALAAPDPKLLERARSILQRAPLIDTHNDIPYALFLKNAGRRPCADLPNVHDEVRIAR